MSVEIAWRKETGRPDVVIAVHDSGIRWRAGDVEGDLRKKFYELCVFDGAGHTIARAGAPRGGTAAGALVGRGRARSSRIEHPRARGLCTRTDAVQIAARAGDPPLAGLLLLPAWHEADRCDHQAVQAR